MRELNYLDAMRTATERLAHGGVFLTVKGEVPNTMTIGWAGITYLWNKPIFLVLVRPQRYSYELLKRAGEFTVSVPTTNPLREELRFAGTQSGRDFDKFTGHGLSAAPAQAISTPVVRECGLHFECKTLLTQEMDAARLDPEVARRCYPAADYHTMFYGEIVACYSTDE